MNIIQENMSLFYSEEKKRIINRLSEYSVPLDQCKIIADVMATADLYGVTTHGISTLEAHIQRLNCSGYNLKPEFKHIRETPAFAVIDGDNSFGFVSADYCMKYAIEKAKQVGVFQVFSKNNNTVGPAFYYPLKAAEQGMIALLFSNSPAQMAPYGGKEKMLGTNPFAAVIPVPDSNPIIIDMATSIVAKSKFKQFKETGEKLPDGWALDKNGNPTNDPDEGIQGLILPMAGFKGYGLSMLIDVLSGLVSGAAYLNKVGRFYSEDGSGMNIGFCCIVINPSIVMEENYESSIKEYIKKLRESEKAGKSEIILPGDDRIAFKNRMCDMDQTKR